MPDPLVGPPRAGDLLVAAPALVDPNFDHSVVLLLDADPDGALGVVLNRPSPVPVREILESWSGAASAPPVLFHGGPVALDSALAVAVLADDAAEHDAPVGWRAVADRIGLLDLDAPVELVSPALSGLRVFAGYAGWGPQQLEEEIAEGSWYVLPALESDLLTAEPIALWSRVLRRQPGELAWVSTRPLDPTMN